MQWAGSDFGTEFTDIQLRDLTGMSSGSRMGRGRKQKRHVQQDGLCLQGLELPSEVGDGKELADTTDHSTQRHFVVDAADHSTRPESTHVQKSSVVREAEQRALLKQQRSKSVMPRIVKALVEERGVTGLVVGWCVN